MKKEIVAAIGLVIGAVFGMAGSMVPSAAMRGVLWGIDGTTIIIACAIMVIHYLRKGDDMIAAGFMVYALGESLVQLVCAMTPEASSPFFAAATALWAAGMAMVSLPKGFPLFVRGTGIIGAILFTVTALEIFAGNMLTPLSKPLPFFAYPFLALTLLGWAWTMLKAARSQQSPV